MKNQVKYFQLAILALFTGLGFFISYTAHAAATIDFGTFYSGQSTSGQTQNFNVGNTSLSGGDSFTFSSDTNSGALWFNFNPNPGLGGTVTAGANPGYTVSLTSKATDGTYSLGSHSKVILFHPSGSTQNPNDSLTVKYNLVSPCVLNSFTASPLIVDYNQNTTLNWSTNYCTVSISGGQFGGGTSEPASGPLPTNNLTSSVTYILTATGANGPTRSSVSITVRPPCDASITASPNTVTVGNSSTLHLNLSGNCNSANISGGVFGGGQSVPVQPTQTLPTGNLYNNTTYTFNGIGPTQTSTDNVTVSITGFCTITVNSRYNYIHQPPPTGIYNFQITGPGNNSPLTGNTNQAFYEPPSDQNWIATYTGGAGAWWDPSDEFSDGGGNPDNSLQSQSCGTVGGNITFTFDFKDQVGPPTNPVANNTSTQGSVNCNNVLLTWGPGNFATSYNIYRNGSPLATVSAPTTTYVDSTADPAVAYTYTIESYDATTRDTSNRVTFTPNPISPTRCVVDLTTSDKVVTLVNGQTYNFNSTCVTSVNNGIVKTIKSGDTIHFQINLCNTGTIDAKNPVIVDTLTLNLTTPSNFKVNGNSFSPTVAGNTITFATPKIAKGTAQIISFDAVVPVNTGSNQSLQRLKNDADITYTSTAILPGDTPGKYGNCSSSYNDAAHACHRDTGYIVFSAIISPTQKEVNP